MANWRDRDDDWRSRRSFDDWHEWRERDRGMEGPRAYGASIRRDEYAGFPRGEEIPRRDWARDYMPDRGYSAYGGGYRQQESSYGRGYPDQSRRELRPQYGRDFRPGGYDRYDWRERDRFARDDEDRTWRDRMQDPDGRLRERFRDRDLDDDRYRRSSGDFDRDFDRNFDRNFGRYGNERPTERYGRDDMGYRLSTPVDDDDYPWDRYPEGRRTRFASERWNEDREPRRNR